MSFSILPSLALEVIAENLNHLPMLYTCKNVNDIMGPTVRANRILSAYQLAKWTSVSKWRRVRDRVLVGPLVAALQRSDRTAFISYVVSKVRMMHPDTYVEARTAVSEDNISAFHKSKARTAFCVAFVRAALMVDTVKNEMLIEPNIELIDALIDEIAGIGGRPSTLPEMIECYNPVYLSTMWNQPSVALSDRGKKLLAVLIKHGNGIMDLACIVQNVLFW